MSACHFDRFNDLAEKNQAILGFGAGWLGGWDEMLWKAVKEDRFHLFELFGRALKYNRKDWGWFPWSQGVCKLGSTRFCDLSHAPSTSTTPKHVWKWSR
jgi:hypothetical protein